MSVYMTWRGPFVRFTTKGTAVDPIELTDDRSHAVRRMSGTRPENRTACRLYWEAFLPDYSPPSGDWAEDDVIVSPRCERCSDHVERAA